MAATAKSLLATNGNNNAPRKGANNGETFVNTTCNIWLEMKASHPKKYARDLAALMSISEAELAHARVGHDAWRLHGDTGKILASLESIGEIKSICRNEYSVHEQVGEFTNLHLGNHAGIVLNPGALDLRLFPQQWNCAFHLRESTARGERQSIQFFDHQGNAILKVYTTDNTNMQAWGDFLTQYIYADNPALVLTKPVAVSHDLLADAEVVEQEWRAMTDVHQFFGLLKRHNLSRQQAFRLVSPDLACQVDNQALSQLLDLAHQDGNAIMIFVGNRGAVQIFSGAVEKLTPMENWINIFNPAFTLHLQENHIAETWITRKPTADGHVTSLELFAEDGTQIAQLYGQRSEGQPEQTQWRQQVESLINQEDAA